jgi:hypothetical protein
MALVAEEEADGAVGEVFCEGAERLVGYDHHWQGEDKTKVQI